MTMLNNMGDDLRAIGDRLRWANYDYGQSSDSYRLMFTGLAAAGKKTLFNALWGSAVLSAESSPSGTLDLGLFRLVDLPCSQVDAEPYPYALDEDGLIVYLINERCGLQPEDFQWIARLRSGRAALMVVLNLIDGRMEAAALAEMEERLGLRVLAIHANSQEEARGVFMDAVLRASPELAVPLAAQIASLRQITAQRMIRQSVVLSMAVSVEPLPLLDVTMLIGLQIHLLHQISTLYGRRINRQGQGELVLTVVVGLLLRFVVQTGLKFIPYAGWLLSGVVGASATWFIGQAALLHYEEKLKIISSPIEILSQFGAKLHVPTFHVPSKRTRRSTNQ